MFKEISILNCDYSFITPTELLILEPNEILIYDLIDFFKQKTIKINYNCSSAFKFNDQIFCTESYYGFLCKLEDNKLLKINPEFLVYPHKYKLNDELILGFSIHENGYSNSSFKAFSINEDKVLWENINLNVRNWILSDAIFADHSERRYFPQCWNEIIKIVVETGEILWKFNTSKITEDMEVSRLVGIWNGILVAGIGEDYMIGINTENGELVWKRKAIPDFDIIDQSLGVLHSLTSGYVKTDIRTGKTLDIFDKEEYFEKEIGIESQRNNYVLVGDHIITSDWKKGKLGAFNTITHRFDWIHEEPGVSFPAGQAMKYFDPYLFVMDSKEVLHIFRKE